MRLRTVAAGLAAGLAAAVPVGAAPARAGTTFAANPPGTQRLVTNEYAYWNPRLPRISSPLWEMTSGSLFSRRTTSGAAYWTGAVDDRAPNVYSSRGTNSAIFRLTTRARDFRNTTVATRLTVNRLGSTRSTPAVAWDGVHLFVRYRSEEHLYYASVARRDGVLVIKKKCPGGPSNGGSYHTLAERGGYRIPYNRWRYVAASAVTYSTGAVGLNIYLGGRLVLRATDRGAGCAPITGAGRVGIRGDNAAFHFQAFRASRH